jgi:hypothetical protein
MRLCGGSVRGAEGAVTVLPSQSFLLAKPFAGTGKGSDELSMTVLLLGWRVWARAQLRRPPWDS